MVSDVVSDEALIARARSGDGDALKALFDRYAALLRDRIRQWLSPALRRKVSASDILQEAYLVALRRVADFEHRGDGSFGRWLARIVELKMREVVRKYAGTDKRGAVAEVSRGARDPTANFAGGAPTPSQMAMASELRQRAAVAMEKLPPDYREIVRLVQEEGLTMAEAAARMGRSRNAVKHLYGRALSRFAKLLGVPYRRRT